MNTDRKIMATERIMGNLPENTEIKGYGNKKA